MKDTASNSDMGAINIKALKLLGATKRKSFFRFHNEETAAVYVSPHLLKCTQNLFLKYVVQLKSEHLGNHLPAVAEWVSIMKLYELNKLKPFRQLYKLTDTHHNPTMKVSFTAQVMGQRPDFYHCQTVAGLLI
jgi:hypothetical protein